MNIQYYLSSSMKQSDDKTLSLAISLNEQYRNLGLGTALMKKMLQFLKDKGYKQTSLSVQRANYAVNMYRKLGFEVVIENEEEYIMLCKLWEKFDAGRLILL